MVQSVAKNPSPITSEFKLDRIHALDAIRSFALLLGIVLHSTISFQAGYIEQGWPIVDSKPSQELDILFYAIHVFRMATFFFVAGFFGHLALHRNGIIHFLRDRTKRIVLPLLLFWPVCISSISGIILWASYKLYNGQLPPTPKPDDTVASFPLTHLWFLYILAWLYLLALTLRALLSNLDKLIPLRFWLDKSISKATYSTFGPIIAAMPIAIMLYAIPNWAWWGGIPTPDQSLIPLWYSLLIYFFIFCLGWLFDRQRSLLLVLKKKWLFNLLLGTIMVVICLSLAGLESNYLPVTDNKSKFIYACCYAVALTSWTCAFIGAGMRFFSHKNAYIRYLADASYWMYILHFTVVIALQTFFADLSLHWLIKFILINTLTCVVLLVSYHWLVRTTWVGSLLNGKRR